MNNEKKNKKILNERENAFAIMDSNIDQKKVKQLERSIEYLNFFLSRKIDKETKQEK